MGRKKKVEPDDKEQSVRFLEIARQIDEEASSETFEKGLKQALTQPGLKSHHDSPVNGD